MMMLVSDNDRSTLSDEHVGKLYIDVYSCDQNASPCQIDKRIHKPMYRSMNKRDDRLGIFQYSGECALNNITEY